MSVNEVTKLAVSVLTF